MLRTVRCRIGIRRAARTLVNGKRTLYFGERNGRRGLHEDRLRNGVTGKQLSDIRRSEVTMDRAKCWRQPAVVAARELPEMLMCIDHSEASQWCRDIRSQQSFALEIAPQARRYARRQGRDVTQHFGCRYGAKYE